MSVMDVYGRKQVQSPFGTPEPMGGVMAPPGAENRASQGYDVFGDVSGALAQYSIGVYAPWASRVGSLDWEVVRQPADTNIQVAAISDQILQALMVITMNQPFGFLAVLSDQLPDVQAPSTAFEGTPYGFYETQAVYSLADTRDPPWIQFLHWARLRNPEDRGGGSHGLDAVAAALHGQLVVAIQVNPDFTQQRPPPGMAFEAALATQLGAGGGVVPVVPVLPPGGGMPVEPLPPVTPGPPAPQLPAPPGAATPAAAVLAVVGAGLVAIGVGWVIARYAKYRKVGR